MLASARFLVTFVVLLLMPAVVNAQLRLNDCVTEGLPSRCGTLRVAEDASNPASRVVTLGVIVVRHRTTGVPKEPLFILKGGPGEAATDDVDDTVRLFGSVLKDHDLVLINQRGTVPGSLRCEAAARAFLARQLRGEWAPSAGCVVQGCLADAACRRTFPAVASQVAALRTGLRDRFEQFGLQALLYSSSTATAVPLVADRVAAGDRTAFETAIQQARASLLPRLTLGLNLAVFCSEELPCREPGVSDHRSFLREEYEEACLNWPRAGLVPDYRTVVRLDIPALVIAGERDPAAPPQWAQLAGAQFTTSQVVIVAGEGHLLDRLDACDGKMTREFIERGRADVSCPRIRPLPYRLR